MENTNSKIFCKLNLLPTRQECILRGWLVVVGVKFGPIDHFTCHTKIVVDNHFVLVQMRQKFLICTFPALKSLFFYRDLPLPLSVGRGKKPSLFNKISIFRHKFFLYQHKTPCEKSMLYCCTPTFQFSRRIVRNQLCGQKCLTVLLFCINLRVLYSNIRSTQKCGCT